MPKLFKKKKEKKKQKQCEQKNTREEKGELPTVLQELEKEENALLQQKRDLLNIEEELQLKIREEIEARKHRIETLKNETVELKRQCEELTNLINIPVPK